jgi:hypothetical protein
VVVDRLRKYVALLSVLLVLTTVRCMADCIVSDAGASTHNSSPAVPPCHKHPAPARGTQHSLPCQNHPGLLAYSIDQPHVFVTLPVTLMASFFEPAQRRPRSLHSASYAHPYLRPDALLPIVLRI